MPIKTPISLVPIIQQEFARLDYRVMRQAFECQNQLGRLCDEVIYQNDLVARLQQAGLPVEKEVPMIVSHRDFAKIYRLDLVVANSAIYELKTATGLIGEHEAQLLNYLFLSGSRHGKLVNFRPVQVESRFINATLTPADRCQFEIRTDHWQERNERDQILRANLVSLLEDWGCWLDVALYIEALVYFLGGEEQVVREVPLAREAIKLGRQRLHLLTPEAAFRVTALTDGIADYERHLRSLLKLTPLRAIQWANLARDCVQLKSLVK